MSGGKGRAAGADRSGSSVSSGARSSPGDGAAPAEGPFCCTGCSLAWHLAGDIGADDGDSHASAEGRLLARVVLSAFLAMGVMVFSLALYGGFLAESGEHEGEAALALEGIYRLGALLMATPIVHLLGLPLAITVLRGRRFLSADALVLCGSAAAYGMSVWHTFADTGEVYFETAAMVLVLFSLGRWLDLRAKVRARAELQGLAPDALEKATRVAADGAEESVAADELAVGELVRVRPGETIPVDGRIEEGRAFLDTALLTGEAEPRAAAAGDAVFAGATSVDGALLVRVEREVGTRLRDEVDRLMREALARPSSSVALADRVAGVLLPLVLAVALGAGVWHGLERGPTEGLWVALSVVLISCPCALGIATPLAFWTALGEAWRSGVLVGGADVLERVARVRTILFDKTGTLTDGEFHVEKVHAHAGAGDRDAAALLGIAAALESGSEHPIGRALRLAGAGSLTAEPVTDFRALPGVGIEARLGGRPLRLRKLDPADPELPPGAADSAASWVRLEDADGRSLASFELSARLRPETPEVIAELREQGFQIAVLTGDNARSGRALADALKVEVEADLNPAQKLERVAARERSLYVGDGLNDTAALAEAEVGVAMWGGSPRCMQIASISLLRPGLRQLPALLGLARRAVRVARMNLVWAFGYNAIGLGFAALGKLTPIFAASAMVLSSVAVALNSRRVVLDRPPEGEPDPRSRPSERAPADRPASAT